MSLRRLDVGDGQMVMHADRTVCTTTQELAESAPFERILNLYVTSLQAHNPEVLATLGLEGREGEQRGRLLDLLRVLANNPLERIAGTSPAGAALLAHREALHDLVEGLYDFWRSFDRFMILRAEAGLASYERRPYRAFTSSAEVLAELVRSLYRDVAEHVTGGRPRVYRQVAAGCEVGVIAADRAWPAPAAYADLLGGIPFVRNVLMYPPLILDPPTNTRTGRFLEVQDNPLAGLSLDKEHFVCYPAVVGPCIVFVYVHQDFLGLGLSLANLFEIASDKQIAAGPDAVYVYGAPPEALARFGEIPTVFYDDGAGGPLVAAVPLEGRFGYFGYLKKMVLTLHNLVVMERGRMPFHGAYTHVALRAGGSANVLLIGDTAAGKSESLEALRQLGEEHIRELRVVADDMGSLEVTADGRLLGFGTEIGAFVRLDDLQRGYAFGQVDRAIIMSPHKVNARVVLPVTTLEEVLHGHAVDFVLYANNYEEVDAGHPLIERFADSDAALRVFREGCTMSKGTTTSTGLVQSYFANVFGPAQRRERHDELARRAFAAAFAAGVFVGQVRTRLAVPGYETEGPRQVAAALLELISQGAEKGAPPP